jgi:transcriptional regulator with XRE-family HTH domain
MQLYKSYAFNPADKDPVIARVRRLVGTAKNKDVAINSGVSPTTLSNWWRPGGTRRPQYCTIAAVAAAQGYEVAFVKKGTRKRDP